MLGIIISTIIPITVRNILVFLHVRSLAVQSDKECQLFQQTTAKSQKML